MDNVQHSKDELMRARDAKKDPDAAADDVGLAARSGWAACHKLDLRCRQCHDVHPENRVDK